MTHSIMTGKALLYLILLVVVSGFYNEAYSMRIFVCDTIPNKQMLETVKSGNKNANASIITGTLSALSAPIGLLLVASTVFESPVFFILGMLLGVIALVSGFNGLKKIRNYLKGGYPGKEKPVVISAKRKSVTGIILGFAGAVLGVILIIIYSLAY
ncbi:hypothetical protein [Dyadobacter sp. NIV53]|uniref:hypothetical protein n=1 Tax=Dyadobacter sp. NIV53 TaxID=2861765 RepID=UPI001C88AF75|nr:hypothetical protein [Dyadobacter sp. NIV53]